MRKKIMATILGTAMLLTAVSFTGCGNSVNDSTSAHTEKTTNTFKIWSDKKTTFKISERNDGRRYIISGNCGN